MATIAPCTEPIIELQLAIPITFRTRAFYFQIRESLIELKKSLHTAFNTIPIVLNNM